MSVNEREMGKERLDSSLRYPFLSIGYGGVLRSIWFTLSSKSEGWLKPFFWPDGNNPSRRDGKTDSYCPFGVISGDVVYVSV